MPLNRTAQYRSALLLSRLAVAAAAAHNPSSPAEILHPSPARAHHALVILHARHFTLDKAFLRLSELGAFSRLYACAVVAQLLIKLNVLYMCALLLYAALNAILENFADSRVYGCAAVTPTRCSL